MGAGGSVLWVDTVYAVSGRLWRENARNVYFNAMHTHTHTMI